MKDSPLRAGVVINLTSSFSRLSQKLATKSVQHDYFPYSTNHITDWVVAVVALYCAQHYELKLLCHVKILASER